MNGGRVQFVGVGGGGLRILSHLHGRWRDLPDLAVVHTNAAALERCTIERRLAMGSGMTEGFSTGGDPEQGRRAAEESADELRALWQDARWGCVVTSLGGGTGGGAAPVLCRLARETGTWTLAVCTLPFFFEGAVRRRRAEESLHRLRATADAVIVMPNQRLFEWVESDTPVARAFEVVDEVVSVALRSLWRLLTQRWLIHVDLADLRRMVRGADSGLAFAAFEAAGENRASDLLLRVRESPLLERGNVVSAARGLLLAAVGGPDLTLSELDRVYHGVSELARPDVEMCIGAAIDPEYEGRIGLTLLATERMPSESMSDSAASPAADALHHPPPTEPAKKDPSRPPIQGTLPLETPGKGRFKGIEPTYFEGEDIDVPAFIRQGIRLSRAP